MTVAKTILRIARQKVEGGYWVYGVPQAQTIAGDLHQVVATIATTGPTPTSPLRATRQVIKYSRTIAPGQLNFGSAMPAPVVSPVAGAPAGRLRFQGALPDEYNTGVSIDITQSGSNNFLTIHTTRGFLGAGNTYDVTTPDLTGAIGWDTQYAIRAGIPVQWWANGGGPVLDYFDARYIFNSMRSRWTGALTGITAPADGATYVRAPQDQRRRNSVGRPTFVVHSRLRERLEHGDHGGCTNNKCNGGENQD